jgi:hypothetical protein
MEGRKRKGPENRWKGPLLWWGIFQIFLLSWGAIGSRPNAAWPLGVHACMHTWTEQSTPRDTESSFIDSVRWNRHTTALCPYYELAAYCGLLVLASHHVLKTYIPPSSGLHDLSFSAFLWETSSVSSAYPDQSSR